LAYPDAVWALTKLVVLDGNELCAEGGDLLLGGRAHVSRRDDSAETAGGGDRLEACHTHTHDERPGSWHGACRRHHHRNGLPEHPGCVDNRFISGQVSLTRYPARLA
jgi:hypothetical protein